MSSSAERRLQDLELSCFVQSSSVGRSASVGAVCRKLKAKDAMAHRVKGRPRGPGPTVSEWKKKKKKGDFRSWAVGGARARRSAGHRVTSVRDQLSPNIVGQGSVAKTDR
eukprot:scaffold7033_cov257-Pinguiococcus_pyrenoidosus.AAC.9